MEIRKKILDQLSALQADPALVLDVKNADDSVITNWVKIIDASTDSLNDWCKALIEFRRWELSENRLLTLAHKIEYLSCCREGGANAGTLVSLSDLLIEYLKNHGVES